MSAWEKILERRACPRRRGRIPCEIRIDGRPHEGQAVDLSPDGLFVQTEARLPNGFPVEIRLRLPDGTAVDMLATLAHRRMVSRSLAAVARDGIGLRIRNASAGYRRWLENPRAARRCPDPALIELTDVVE